MPAPAPKFWNALVNLVVAIEERINGRIRAHLSIPDPTNKQRVTDTRYVLNQLRELDRQAPPLAREAVSRAYEAGRAEIGRKPQVDLFPVVRDVSRINREATNILADNIINKLGEAAQTVGRRTDDIFRRHGLHAAAARASQGENLPYDYQASQMERMLREKGIKTFEDRSGRNWQLSTYTKMVVRTTTSEAIQRGVIDAQLDRNLDLVDILHANMPHEGHEVAPICKPYEGKTFSLTGATPGYPLLDRIPPFHPNCDHYVMVSPLAFEERRKAEAIEEAAA